MEREWGGPALSSPQAPPRAASRLLSREAVPCSRAAAVLAAPPLPPQPRSRPAPPRPSWPRPARPRGTSGPRGRYGHGGGHGRAPAEPPGHQGPGESPPPPPPSPLPSSGRPGAASPPGPSGRRGSAEGRAGPTGAGAGSGGVPAAGIALFWAYRGWRGAADETRWARGSAPGTAAAPCPRARRKGRCGSGPAAGGAPSAAGASRLRAGYGGGVGPGWPREGPHPAARGPRPGRAGQHLCQAGVSAGRGLVQAGRLPGTVRRCCCYCCGNTESTLRERAHDAALAPGGSSAPSEPIGTCLPIPQGTHPYIAAHKEMLVSHPFS